MDIFIIFLILTHFGYFKDQHMFIFIIFHIFFILVISNKKDAHSFNNNPILSHFGLFKWKGMYNVLPIYPILDISNSSCVHFYYPYLYHLAYLKMKENIHLFYFSILTHFAFFKGKDIYIFINFIILSHFEFSDVSICTFLLFFSFHHI